MIFQDASFKLAIKDTIKRMIATNINPKKVNHGMKTTNLCLERS